MPKIESKSEEQKDAEDKVEGFKSDLGPFVVAAETTRMAMVFADARASGNPLIFTNDSFLSLTGYAREEVLGQSFNFLMAHAGDAEALAKIEAEFQGKATGGCEIRYRRKDHSEFWAALFISPVRDESGDIVQYFASFVDLTKHKEEENRRAKPPREKHAGHRGTHKVSGTSLHGASRRGGAMAANGTRRHAALDRQVAAPLIVFLAVDLTPGVAFLKDGKSR